MTKYLSCSWEEGGSEEYLWRVNRPCNDFLGCDGIKEDWLEACGDLNGTVIGGGGEGGAAHTSGSFSPAIVLVAAMLTLAVSLLQN